MDVTLSPGHILTAVIEKLALDYWCFMGASGDNISLSFSPTGSDGDLVIGLFGPPDFGAIGSPFATAQILNVDLTVDGMYLIGVLDLDAGMPEYALTD